MSKRKRGAMRAVAQTFALKPGFTANFAGAMSKHARDIRVGLGERDTGFEPCDALATEADQTNIRAIDPQRQDQRDRAVHELKRGRHYTDHRVQHCHPA